MFRFNFSLVTTRGPGFSVDGLESPGLGKDEICELITTYVTLVVRVAILEVCGSIRTMLIEMFDEHYVAGTEAATITTVDFREEGLYSIGSSTT